MRNMYALLVGASLSLAPAVSLASAPHVTSQPSLTHATQQTASAPASTLPGVSAGAKTNTDDFARYAAKDASSADAKDYRGGDTVVIGATAATAILAVLLLVILL
jgi:hypothetical protein